MRPVLRPLPALLLATFGLVSVPRSLASEEEPCDAEIRAKQEAEEARRKYLLQEVLATTEETLRDAREIAETWRAARRERFTGEFRSELEARLRPRTTRPDRDAWITAGACRAMASRDEAACRALPIEREREPCRAVALLGPWIREHGRTCEGVPDWMSGACRALLDPEGTDCAALDPARRHGCDLLRSTLLRAREACGEPLSLSDCLMATAIASARDGVASCDLTHPAAIPDERPDPFRAPLTAMCRAIALSEPRRCPSAGLGDPTGVGSLSRAAVLPGPSGAFGLVAVGTDTPAACHVAWAFRPRSAGDDVPAAVAASTRVLETASWSPAFLEVPLPAGADPEALEGEVAAVCVPWPWWPARSAATGD